MKAVIIAESENIIEEFSQYYKSNGYDIIVYHWLMKAMDNIEEIDPDLIFINAEEYPRHWKILCQYITGINKSPKIVLYSSSNLKDEDNEKAKILNIDSVINSTEDLEEVCTLEELCPTTTEHESEVCTEEASEVEPERDVEPASEVSDEVENEPTCEVAEEIELEPESDDAPIIEEEPATEIVDENKIVNCKFLFTHPESFVLITGKVKEFAIPKLIFIPDNLEDTKDLQEQTIINRCTLKIDENIKTVNAKIIKNANEIEFVI